MTPWVKMTLWVNEYGHSAFPPRPKDPSVRVPAVLRGHNTGWWGGPGGEQLCHLLKVIDQMINESYRVLTGRSMAWQYGVPTRGGPAPGCPQLPVVAEVGPRAYVEHTVA